MTIRVTPGGAAGVLCATGVLLLLAHLASMTLWYLDENRLSAVLVEKFSFEGEANFPAFFSSLLLLSTAVLFAIVARCSRSAPPAGMARYWSALAAVFGFLTLDEAVQLHEKLDTDLIWASVETSGLLAWPWVTIYGVVVVVFVAAFFRFWRALPAGYRWRYALAAAVYVGAALGFEMLEALVYTTRGGATPLFYLLVTVEETLEMAAIIYTIHTTLRYIANELPAVAVRVASGSSVLADVEKG